MVQYQVLQNGSNNEVYQKRISRLDMQEINFTLPD